MYQHCWVFSWETPLNALEWPISFYFLYCIVFMGAPSLGNLFSLVLRLVFKLGTLLTIKQEYFWSKEWTHRQGQNKYTVHQDSLEQSKVLVVLKNFLFNLVFKNDKHFNFEYCMKLRVWILTCSFKEWSKHLQHGCSTKWLFNNSWTPTAVRLQDKFPFKIGHTQHRRCNYSPL